MILVIIQANYIFRKTIGSYEILLGFFVFIFLKRKIIVKTKNYEIPINYMKNHVFHAVQILAYK